MLMKLEPYGLAGVLRAQLGERWNDLHADIRARFTLPEGTTRQSFSGSMHEIERSPLGWLMAKLIAFVRILPAKRARNVPFEFNLRAAPGYANNSGWVKERIYHFRSGDFMFRSVMSFSPEGELIEQFPYKLGMKIKLGAEGAERTHLDTLTFRDDGYFLRIGRFRLPLPRWLGVGRFTLAHKNIDRKQFSVAIRLDHPLFGNLFYQYGEFTEAPVRHRTRNRNISSVLTPSRLPSA